MTVKQRSRARTIALLTDFGFQDNYVGVMKGVILQVAPVAHVVDICHGIPPGGIRSASFLLERSWDYFPPRTVFLAVVDPGVGGERRALALQAGGSFFVGPDNGVFSSVLDRAEEQGMPVRVVTLSRPEYWLPKVSHTFHGRDIFAPVAAHLASGVPLRNLGDPTPAPVRLSPVHCRRKKGRVEGEVVYIDRFGNLVTSIRAEDTEYLLKHHVELLVEVGGRKAGALAGAYGAVGPGDPVSVIGGFGCLEVSVNGGSAADRFRAELGDRVTLEAGRDPARKKRAKKSC